MAGKRRRRKKIEVNGLVMWNAKITANELDMNEQHLRRLANAHKVPGHLEGKQWFFNLERVRKAQEERFSDIPIEEKEGNVLELDSAVKSRIKISRMDILNDPLAGL